MRTGSAVGRTMLAASAFAAVVATGIVPAATSSAGLPACAAAQFDLRIQKPKVDDPVRPHQFDVVLTNKAAACTVQGFPGVDLTGPKDPTFGATYSLPRQAVSAQPLTVQPRNAVVAILTYQPGDWVPTTLVVTPPDTITQLRVPWPSGVGVARQDGATHPGTYIGSLSPL
ncbi:DUF4232 domain-containing protein [Nocardia jiangxiensis]|uniref:DUF4232 domain-containing protein n=1 Tax=Nocardia jiangxiensis TaxID=282685 RepID=UPI0007C477BC|nr:DUF4232 domain-containing protein [Nocardia jiangxiensis]